MVKRSVIFYRTGKDECPVQDFLDSLPGKVAQKITWVLKLVEDLDVVPSTYFKNLLGQKEFGSAEFNTVRMPIAFYAFFLQIL